MGKWTDSLTIEMLPEQHQELAKIIGVQNFLKVAAQFGGHDYYIPKREALLRETRNRMIRKQYTGYNAKELSKLYGLTERWITTLCRQDTGDDDTPPVETPEDSSDVQMVIWNAL